MTWISMYHLLGIREDGMKRWWFKDFGKELWLCPGCLHAEHRQPCDPFGLTHDEPCPCPWRLNIDRQESFRTAL